MFFGKVASRLTTYPAGQKFCRNCSISLHFRDKLLFFVFTAEIKMAAKNTLWVKNFVKITLSRSVSEINAFLRLTQKFKMAAKSGGKTIFPKSRQ